MLPGFCTPLTVIQGWSASTATMAPLAPRTLVEGVGDLGGKALLELRTAGVTLYHPGQLQPIALPSGM